jgi:transposase-like protein
MASETPLSLIDERFTDPVVAAEYLESIRWPDGVVCPKCGESEREPYRLKGKSLKNRRVWKCRACRRQFTVMVGTIFESSHVPLNKWLAAFYLLCSSKKGMSAHQLHRMLDVTYKTAWFMFHRIREAMKEPAFADKLGGVVEADETYVGGKRKNMHGKETRGRPPQSEAKTKTAVLALVEREGRVRSQRVANVTAKELGCVIAEQVDTSARLMTDELRSYERIGWSYADHKSISHGRGEYVVGEAHTNTVEGYFSILKRGINGVYHHVSREHLNRYLSEFDFRYNHREVSDSLRTVSALQGAEGKRLKYRETR